MWFWCAGVGVLREARRYSDPRRGMLQPLFKTVARNRQVDEAHANPTQDPEADRDLDVQFLEPTKVRDTEGSFTFDSCLRHSLLFREFQRWLTRLKSAWTFL